MSISRGNVPAFADAFNTVARAHLTPEDLVPELRIDMEIPLASATTTLESMLRHLEPCGVGNPSPVLMARHVMLEEPPRIVGESHLKICLHVEGAKPLEGIGFSLGSRIGELDVARPFDIAFRLERSEYKGVERLQARIADFRSA